jgi:hypothetical protein
MLALALALLLTGAPAEASPCTSLDEAGAAFAICFDPGNGLLVGAGQLVQAGEAGPELQAGFLLRSTRTSSTKGTPWFNTHRILDTHARGGTARRSLTTTLYDGTLRRHLEDGFILIPTARPVRIPFPFDLALALRVGHLERRVWEGPGWTLETGRAALLLDPLRSPTGRVWLGVGPAAGHILRRTREGTVHELTPFTSALIDAGYETEDGAWTLRARALAGWTFGFDGVTRFRARAEAGVERLLVAVNDQPVWLKLSAERAHEDAGTARRSEWTLGAGLVLRAGSARW